MPTNDDLSEVRFGPYESGDEKEILRVFRNVFGVERSMEAWRWEYEANPAGLHVFLAKLPDGRVLSQFAGIPRRMKVRDDVRTFAEIVDSFTDPDFRAGLKKPGLFATTCYRFVDAFGRPDREAIMYGLPNPPAFRVGRALLGYVHLDDIQFLTKDLEGEGENPGESLQGGLGACREVAAFSEDVDALYERFQQAYEVLTIRDRRYLGWRFVHPETTYERCELRDPQGRLFALAVLRHEWLDQPQTALCEWMADEGHPALPAALRHLETRARAAGSHRLQLLLRPDIPLCRFFRDQGYHLESTRFRFVARTYDKDKLPLDWLKQSWFISLGDFDIV